jgi:hypothetical protein
MKHMNMSVPRDCDIRYGALSLALLFACPALAYTGEKLAKDAKVSMAEARAIALKAHPGKITDEELEYVKPEEPAYVIHSTSKVEAPRRRLALTLERGGYWRTPRRVRTPINGIRLSARAMVAEGVPGADPARPEPSFPLFYSNNFRDVPS